MTIRIETHPHYRPEKKRELMDALWEHLAENKCLGTLLVSAICFLRY